VKRSPVNGRKAVKEGEPAQEVPANRLWSRQGNLVFYAGRGAGPNERAESAS